MRRLAQSITAAFVVFAVARYFVPLETTHAQAISSTLATLAQGMAEGTWVALTGSNINDGSNIGQCFPSGCIVTGNRLPYSFSAAWDENRHLLHYVGQDHGENPNVPPGCNSGTNCDPSNNNVLKYMVYSESTNTWAIVCGPPPTVFGGGCGFGSAHGGDHIAVDPILGTVFEKEFGPAGVAPERVWKYPGTGGSWAFSETAHSPNGFDYMNGIAWWESQTLKNSDTGGTLFDYNCNAPNGQIFLYSPRRDTWFGDGTGSLAGFGGTSTYNCFAAYSPIYNVAIMGGGNDNLKKLWKMDQDWTVTAMTDSPVALGVQHGYKVTVDPVTGLFLVIGNGEMYTYDPTGTGTFTLQTGSRVPPAGLYSGADSPSQDMVVVPIKNYGVILAASCNSASPCNMYLYKHSAGSPWAARSTAAGVVRAFSFDTTGDFTHCVGGTTGCIGSNFGIVPIGGGTADYSQSGRDTSVKAEGASSLFFTVPQATTADCCGSWFTNFSSDLATQFGAGQEFYAQWRQRFDSNYLANGLTGNWGGGGGWKQVILGTGDTMSMIQSSCTTLELVTQNTSNLNFPQWYNSCTGSTSHGPFNGLNETFGAFDFKMQNQRANPYCLYSQGVNPGSPSTCFPYLANEWLTFQVHLKIGPRGSAGVPGMSPNDEFVNSTIEAWIARDGGFSQQVLNFGPFNLSADPPPADTKYGKIWLIPYDTSRLTSGTTYPVAETWYDSMIISTNRIIDPPSTGAASTEPFINTVTPSNVLLNATTNVTITGGQLTGVTSATISGSGITTSGITVNSDSSMTLNLIVSSMAATGTRSITVTSPGGTSNAINFTVSNPSMAPTLTSIFPGTLTTGTTTNVALTGTALTGVTSATIGGGSGITTANLVVLDNTDMSIDIIIDPAASPLPRTISVTSPGGTSNAFSFQVILPGQAEPRGRKAMRRH